MQKNTFQLFAVIFVIMKATKTITQPISSQFYSVQLPISLLWSRVTPPPQVAPAEVPNSGWPSNPGALITTVGDVFPDDAGENEEGDLERDRLLL